VRVQLGAKQNWSDTDDLAMLFRGTYSTEFYRRLRTALHEEARPDADRGALDELWRALAADEALHRAPELAGAAA